MHRSRVDLKLSATFTPCFLRHVPAAVILAYLYHPHNVYQQPFSPCKFTRVAPFVPLTIEIRGSGIEEVHYSPYVLLFAKRHDILHSPEEGTVFWSTRCSACSMYQVVHPLVTEQGNGELEVFIKSF